MSFIQIEVAMRIELRQGVPEECTAWLWEHVGPGNLTPIGESSSIHGYNHDELDNDEYVWFYERITKPKTPESLFDEPFEYVPTITIKDEKLAMVFTLRWL